MEPSAFPSVFDRDPIDGNTIFHDLAETGSVRLFYRLCGAINKPCSSVLVKNYVGEASVHVAAKKHRGLDAAKLIEILMEFGADPNVGDGFAGDTILHCAVFYKDYELAEWLCMRPEINLNSRNCARLTAYQSAFTKKDQRMMDILRKHGADGQTSKSASSDEEN